MCPPWQAADVALQLLGTLESSDPPILCLPIRSCSCIDNSTHAPEIIAIRRLENPPHVPQRPEQHTASQGSSAQDSTPIKSNPIAPRAASLDPVKNAADRALPPPAAGAIYIYHCSDDTPNLKYHHHLRQRRETIHLRVLAAGSPPPLLHHSRYLGRCVRATGRGGRR